MIKFGVLHKTPEEVTLYFIRTLSSIDLCESVTRDLQKFLCKRG